MSPAAARVVANAVLGIALAAGTLVVLRRPTLRCRAAQIIRLAATTWIPAYLANEIRRAWDESARSTRSRDRAS